MAALTEPRGPNPYPIPEGFTLPPLDGPNILDPHQVARFLSTIPGDDVRAAVLQDVMSYSTLGQALDSMLLAIAGAWVGFDTTPPLPVTDHLINPKGALANSGGGGGGGGMPRKVLV